MSFIKAKVYKTTLGDDEYEAELKPIKRVDMLKLEPFYEDDVDLENDGAKAAELVDTASEILLKCIVNFKENGIDVDVPDIMEGFETVAGSHVVMNFMNQLVNDSQIGNDDVKKLDGPSVEDGKECQSLMDSSSPD